MCGKFTQMMSWGTLVALSDLIARPEGDDEETVTPMRFGYVVTLDDAGVRKVARMRWGLIPPDARDPTAIRPHIHARAETIDTKPTFRDAFRSRRGLLVVSTFNEGKDVSPTRTEQYVLTPQDGRPVSIAVIWERWNEPHAGSLLTFAMVTVPANALIGTLTDRMPALIADEHWAKWLGEEPATMQELKAMLQPSERALDLRKATKPAPKNQPGLF